MPRQILIAGLLLTVTACATAPMRWESPGAGDASRDEAACQLRADNEAARRLPYGNGPPIVGFHSNWSMITWKQAIDDERYYVARDLMHACMLGKGYRRVPVSSR